MMSMMDDSDNCSNGINTPKMELEIQVALNFVISYLYNKLPRRRVNLFGEELERAMKARFQGHWYPDKPMKGSAFRCLKTSDHVDPIIGRAAVESGMHIQDVLEHLPNDLCVWVDPGEVSYRISEKGSVKILYSASTDGAGVLGMSHLVNVNKSSLLEDKVQSSAFGFAGHHQNSSSSPSVVDLTESTDSQESSSSSCSSGSFNPEAECFRPIESLNLSLGNLSLSSGSPKNSVVAMTTAAEVSCLPQSLIAQSYGNLHQPSMTSLSPSPSSYKAAAVPVIAPNVKPSIVGAGKKGSNGFVQRPAQYTFTTAEFAQTKFGSTKLKNNSKRANRMSPTEFSHYIKQRALQQVGNGLPGNDGMSQKGMLQYTSPIGQVNYGMVQQQQRPRSLSPKPMPDPYFYQQVVQQHPPTGPASGASAANQSSFAQFSRYDHGGLNAGGGVSGCGPLSPFGSAADIYPNQAQTHYAPGLKIAGQDSLGRMYGGGLATGGGGAGSNHLASASLVSPPSPQGLSASTMDSLLNGNPGGKQQQLFDGLGYNLGTLPYASQYQHLLVAN